MPHNGCYRTARAFGCWLEVVMTRRSIHEYAAAIRGRYLGARKRAKGAILDEFVRVTGYHRKAAVRLLRRDTKEPRGRGPGRPRQYGQGVAAALKAMWEASRGNRRVAPTGARGVCSRSSRSCWPRWSGTGSCASPRPWQLRCAQPVGRPWTGSYDPTGRAWGAVAAARPVQGVFSRARSPSAPSPSGRTPSPASSRLT